jgi:hypothetical protein
MPPDDHTLYPVGARVVVDPIARNFAAGKTGTVSAWKASHTHSGLVATYSIRLDDGATVHDVWGGHVAPAPPVVRIHKGYDRSIRVYVNGNDIGGTNYDQAGWAGLDLIETIAAGIAHAVNLTVETCEGDDTYCDDGQHVI